MLAPYKTLELAPAEPKTFTPDIPGLIAWLETQAPETEYDWYSITDCLVIRFLRVTGDIASGEHEGGEYLGFMHAEDGRRGELIGSALCSSAGPSTYGAALARLKERFRG